MSLQTHFFFLHHVFRALKVNQEWKEDQELPPQRFVQRLYIYIVKEYLKGG